MAHIVHMEFQSTFPRGERQNLVYVSEHIGANFNPRFRVGNDLFLKHSALLHLHFNPRSRVGNDATKAIGKAALVDFNPRSRVGNDDYQCKWWFKSQYFNPRSRVGNDPNQDACADEYGISIHVPAWGTT